MVISIVLPDIARAPETMVDFMRSEGFPGVDDFRKVVAWEWLHDDVNVVGHDTPGMQDVALALKIPEGPGDKVRDYRLTEEALAMPGIEELLNPLRVKEANAFFLLGGKFAVCP